MTSGNKVLQKTTLALLVSAALGASVTAPNAASAATLTFAYSGYFRMLDPTGGALANSSIAAKGGANQFETPISGTLTYDTATGTGTGTMSTFAFFGSPIPAALSGFTIKTIGDGSCASTAGCAGPLLLTNMIFNWGGNNGIPVSLVMDASALFAASAAHDLSDIPVPTTFDASSTGSLVGAADGVYVNVTGTHITSGYLNLGAAPIATTKWDTTSTCTPGGGNSGACMGVAESGTVPLVVDPVGNNKDYVPSFLNGTGQFDPGIGGSPMLAGPFEGYSANFDLTSVVLQSNSDLSTPFTPPAAISITPNVGATTPTTYNLTLGTVTDEAGTATVEYSTDGKPVDDNTKTWVLDNGTNTIPVDITQTVTQFTVDWRATDPCCSAGYGTQAVAIDVVDTTPPTLTAPGPVTVDLTSTSTAVSFGAATASDNIEPNVTIEWSLDNTTWSANDPNGNSTTSFGPDTNTVYWRATDAHGNTATAQQTVTVNLPTGIVGQACQVDLATAGSRLLEGTFIMRDSHGSLIGTPDTAVTGNIDTTALCTDASCTTSGASLISPTPFYGYTWSTSQIRLFGPGTYSFDTIQDGNPKLNMTVGTGQIGAHMLFNWGKPNSPTACGVTNCDIDVVVVWQPSCGSAMLKTIDPDGDGIPGSKMVDGPFKGDNATFYMNTKAGEPPITTGGYAVSVPAIKNSVDGASPLPLAPGATATTAGTGVTMTAAELGASGDSAVTQSCVGGCFDFTASGLANTGDSIQVVLPLSEPIPWYSIYRKYDPATQTWRAFDTSSGDKVETALKNSDGLCPEPGSGSYASYSSGILAGMLHPGDQCVQLTIKDGGPNDNDLTTAKQISDPSGVGVTSGPTSPTTTTSDGGGGSGDWLSLTGLLAAFSGRLRRRQRK